MLRRLHTYMSIVSAPIILFFCLTGALQLFGWHESRGGYHAPVLLEELGMLHKKQRFAVRGGGGGGPHAGPDGPPGSAPSHNALGGDPEGGRAGNHGGGFEHGSAGGALRALLLRWVFLLATLSLVASTVMGAWIGLTHARRKRLCWMLLAAGTVLPVLMVAL